MGASFLDFNENIISSRAYKALPSRMKLLSNEQIPPYAHTTFSVTSVAEYLEVVNVISDSNREIFTAPIYRGMSNAAWELMPSLGRYGSDYGFMEHDMVSEMLTLRPEEFKGIASPFDLIAKMQHFGIPTRLLDFTLNPLVALYFAVKPEYQTHTKAGRVVVTADRESAHSRSVVDAICASYEKIFIEHYMIDTFLPEGTEVSDYLRLNMGLLTLKPSYSNERIKRQSAVFMIFPNAISDRYALLHKFYGTDGIISLDDKYNSILKYEKLDDIYIGDFSAMDDISREQIEKIYRTYNPGVSISSEEHHRLQEAFRENTKNRFSLSPSLAKIDDNILEKGFVSIIIKPRYKEKILRELDRININESFLFPELEYTAKSIKEKVVSQWHEAGFPQ